ncbi:MAG: hypothetical protein K5681_10130 [Treponema sp.]|nr:hypothetical protein [Treponema sp.]
MRLRKIFLIFALLFSVTTLSAQSAKVVTDILNSDKASMGQVCYLVAVNQGYIKEDASYSEAITALYNRKLIPYMVYEDTPVAFVNLAYLYSQIFDVKGGLFYKLFHGAPRYAYKQLKYDGVLPENTYPNKLVSGPEALDIYTSCMMEYSDFQLSVE